MGVLSWIAPLVPIMLEHGPPMVRDWLKARMDKSKAQADQLQEVAGAIEQLREHAIRVDSNLDTLNSAVTANESKLRKWVVTLVIWNVLVTLVLMLLAAFALRR